LNELELLSDLNKVIIRLLKWNETLHDWIEDGFTLDLIGEIKESSNLRLEDLEIISVVKEVISR
jgi:hypothetical protein